MKDAIINWIDDNMWYLIPLIALSILLTGSAVLANSFGKYQCTNYAKLSGKETRWMTLDACYIKTEEGFMRYDEYKMRAVTNE